MRLLAPTAAMAILIAAPQRAPAEPSEIAVMVVGSVHLGNPGRDIHNLHVDDVLTARRQIEIQEMVDGLARFRPTRVLLEMSDASAGRRYALYRAGTLPPSRSETVQLGFRLAKQVGLTAVGGVDVGGEFPYDAVQQFAASHGELALLSRFDAVFGRQIEREQYLVDHGSLREVFRFENAPANIAEAGQAYRLFLNIGQGSVQPGADLLSSWYRRNFYIAAHIAQVVKPGDRVVVIYGAGHAFLLRQFVSEMPGWRLVDPLDFL